MWKDILITILPVIVSIILTWGLNIFNKYISSKIENEKIKELLERTTDIINTVVTSTTQTFVDNIKGTDQWTKETMEEAFKISKENALTLIDEQSRGLIEKYVGEFDIWLESKIEQAVKNSK